MLSSRSRDFLKRVVCTLLVFVFSSVFGFFCFSKNSFFKKSSINEGREQSSSLTCGDLVQMAQWGASHHGFKAVSLQSQNAAKKTAELFVEKLDPQHVLFLASEVADLKTRALAFWDSFLKRKDCSVFDSWFDENVNPAKRRFIEQAILFSQQNSWPPTKSMKRKAANKNYLFAKNSQELSQRQNNLIQELVNSTPLEVLKSYRNHPEKFFQERVEEVYPGEHLNLRSILAKSILGSLDPYSTYFSKGEFKDFYEELSGESAGVGIRVQKSLNGLWVEETLPQSPAKQAGVKRGDVIVKINNQSLDELNFNQATDLLKGAKDAPLNLTIASQQENKTLTLTRSESAFQDKKVSAQWMKTEAEKRVFVISIPSFYGKGGMGGESEEESSSEDVKNQLDQLQKNEEGAAAVVLDLRGNPGGYLEEAVMMAGLFLGSETIVGVKDSSETRILKSENREKALYEGPLVVLVDGDTASAGEVLAAALKEHQRALLVGSSSTFGKGSVQKLFQLDDPFLDFGTTAATGVMKLTTSIFYSPLGHSPANGGVTTQVQLEDSDKERVKSFLPYKVEEISPLVDAGTLVKLQQRESLLQEAIATLDMSKPASGFLAKNASELMMRDAAEIAGIFSGSSFEALRQSVNR